MQHTPNNKGVIGSCAVRIFDLKQATGLNEKEPLKPVFPSDSVYIIPTDKVGAYAEKRSLHLAGL